jgi:hypothetical protein
MQLKFTCRYIRSQHVDEKHCIPLRLQSASCHAGFRRGENTRALLRLFPDKHFVQDAPSHGLKPWLKPNSFSILYGPTKVVS